VQRSNDGEPEPDLDAIRPYLDLAREIQAEVARTAEDASSDGESLVAAIAAVPERERARVLRAVFDRLPAERQWSIIEEAFGDDAIRHYLADERTARLDEIHRAHRHRTVLAASRSERRLDLEALPPGEELLLGLFRPADVRAALDRGRLSDTCARQLVLRTTPDPRLLRVIDDVFNPRSAMFVTAAYDERVWNEERLTSHASVRIGSIISTASGDALETVLYPGARVDVELEVDGAAVLRTGRLHLGFALLGGDDVFMG
jgi:hypothetical protein